MRPAREEILELMRSGSYRPLLLKDLLRSLNMGRDEQKPVKRLLRELIREGKVARLDGDRYALAESRSTAREDDLVIGTLKAHRDGFGFVIPETEGETDLYINRRNMADALNGDRVSVKVMAERGEKREGRIVKVLERRTREVVGRYEEGRFGGMIVPNDERILYDIGVARSNRGDANDGDVVVARLLSDPQPGRPMSGQVIRVLGRSGDPAIDTDLVCEKHHLPRGFPPQTAAAAESLPDQVSGKMLAGRKDLRDLPTVTIDGETAKDFDDAVSIQALPGGSTRLWVSIADVDHYVPWNSPLDLEARARGTSVYFPDRVVPMFPEKLSNGICSLNPGEDRLTWTAEMTFDMEGRQTAYEIYPSVIRSNERMTYTHVAAVLAGADPDLSKRYAAQAEDFKRMERLCRKRIEQRRMRGSIDFDLPESQIVLNIQGETTDILREERNIAHRIIEEFMLAANETVAAHLTRMEVPMIYRIHERPDPLKLETFNAFIQTFGVRLPGGAKARPGEMQEVLDAVRGKPYERLINHLLLRSMKQARYSEENAGHYGLAAEIYCHFTSPIRRYPDLVVHRLLHEIFKTRRMSSDRKAGLAAILPEIARHCSERERVAVDAEREAVEIKKTRFMADKVGEEFSGFVSGVANFGLFVELESVFVEGMIPVSGLDGDYFVFVEKEHALIGRHKGKIFRIGDSVRVRVAEVDIERRQIVFRLAESRGEGAAPTGSQRPVRTGKTARERGREKGSGKRPGGKSRRRRR